MLEPPRIRAAEEPLARAAISLRPVPGFPFPPDHVRRVVSKVGEAMDLAGLPMHPSLDRPVLEAELDAERVLDVEQPDDLVREVGRSNAMVGMRLHGCILAATQGVPVLPIAYHHKVTAFADQLGLAEVPLASPLQDKAVDALVEVFLESRDEERARLRERAGVVRREGLAEVAAALAQLPFDAPHLGYEGDEEE